MTGLLRGTRTLTPFQGQAQHLELLLLPLLLFTDISYKSIIFASDRVLESSTSHSTKLPKDSCLLLLLLFGFPPQSKLLNGHVTPRNSQEVVEGRWKTKHSTSFHVSVLFKPIQAPCLPKTPNQHAVWASRRSTAEGVVPVVGSLRQQRTVKIHKTKPPML